MISHPTQWNISYSTRAQMGWAMDWGGVCRGLSRWGGGVCVCVGGSGGGGGVAELWWGWAAAALSAVSLTLKQRRANKANYPWARSAVKGTSYTTAISFYKVWTFQRPVVHLHLLWFLSTVYGLCWSTKLCSNSIEYTFLKNYHKYTWMIEVQN